jgi:formylglycine-generating enzyme required for sulfatase activity/predicted MPP superfamily phosphohydrolase
MSHIRWLHLSDIHFNFQNYDTARMRAALKEYLLGLKTKFDFLFITGDLRYKNVAYSNDLAEYIKQLSHSLGIGMQNTFIVPGNHDVTRSKIRENLLKGIAESDDTDNAVDDDTGAMLLNGISGFGLFYKSLKDENYLDNGLSFSNSKVHFVRKTPIANIVHLNTSILSGMDGEEGKLCIAGRTGLLEDLKAIKEDKKANIAIGHHTVDCLTKKYRDKLVNLFCDYNVDLYLCGHVHESGCFQDGRFVQITSGSGMADISSEKHETDVGFTTGELDTDTGATNAVFYRWSQKLEKWDNDHEATRKAPQGIWSFSINRFSSKNGLTEKPIPQSPSTPVYDPTRYFEWLNEECTWVELRGLQVPSGKAHKFKMADLYTPLYTTAGLKEEEGRSDKIGMQQRKVNLDELVKQPRSVIIGDPGSGKSTFIRHIGAIICRTLLKIEPDASKERLDISIPPVPLYVRLGKLGEHMQRCKDQNSRNAPLDGEGCEWIIHYLAVMSVGNGWGLTADYFRSVCDQGKAILLLDGLDEPAGRLMRERIAAIVTNMIRVHRHCTFLLTSRPTEEALLRDFNQYTIAPLEREAVDIFLMKWSQALYEGYERKARGHFETLRKEVMATAEIRRMATNPVMLTALAVLHWNDMHLPDQRAELYKSIITWLLRAREKRVDRPGEDLSRRLHQRLAYAMQSSRGGRRTSIDKVDAAVAVAPLMQGNGEREKLDAARKFVDDEELDSGIIVSRGNSVVFWHLTFQEYLAAREFGELTDAYFKNEFGRLTGDQLLSIEWRETLLLLAGVFYGSGIGHVRDFFSNMLIREETHVAILPEHQRLALQARYFSLMCAMVRDLSVNNFVPEDKRYLTLRDEVTAIFNKEKAARIEPCVRSDAADALGQAGDERIHNDLRDCVINRKIREKMMVLIPGGEFLMGAQKKDKKKANYDEMAYDDKDWNESPVHKVRLTPFWIAKYQVTVGQYELFVKDDGYKRKEFWNSGGFGKYPEPGSWERQKDFPTRPVVEVCWLEAAAFCRWVKVSLPTEAQWERAARGQYKEYQRYSWKGLDIDGNHANWRKSGIGHPSPVGIFPAGATEEGVFDMAGNVWEWCRDWYGAYTEGNSVDPVGPEQGETRVLRGGSWGNLNPGGFRCSDRNWLSPVLRYDVRGFRFVFSGI